MLYILDSANVEEIRRCMEYFPIDGVTTNPTIISREKRNFLDLIKELRETIGPERMLHIQATAYTVEGMVEEALCLKEIVGGEFYIKIPVSDEGIKATMMLKKLDVKVTETAIFTQPQALLAAKAGADFVAPYVNRLDNIVSDGVSVVSDIVSMFSTHNIESKVLAASFKNVEQVHSVILKGGHAVTITPELCERMLYHPLTVSAISDFDQDWRKVYGDKRILDLI